jgi:hypothetical protein
MKNRVAKVVTFAAWFAARRRIWNHIVAHMGCLIDVYVPSRPLRSAVLAGVNAGIELVYTSLYWRAHLDEP